MTPEALVRKARAGDQDAYATLYKLLKPRVTALSWKFFKGGHQTDEFVCDALSKILTSLRQFDGRSQFTTWATRVAINLALQRLTRENRVARNSVGLDSSVCEGGDPLVDILPDPVDEYTRIEAKNQLATLLARVPYKDREILTLAYVEGHSNEELAEMLRTTVPGVKSRKTHAFRRVREQALVMN
jgi:RNA polymerase sigma-70 factor (ECF subfamily)